MKSSHNKKQNDKTQKTKTKLQQELSKAHDSLKQQKIELTACHQELKQAKAKITVLEKKQAEFASTEREIERLQINLRNMSDESDQLKEEIDLLKKAKQNLEEENEILNNQLKKELNPISEKDITESIIKIDELASETESQQLQYMSAKTDDEEPIQEESSVKISPSIPAKLDDHESIQEENDVKIPPPIPAEIDDHESIQEENSIKIPPPIPAEIDEQQPVQEKKAVENLPRFPSKTEQNVIQELSIQQSNLILKNGESISSQLPFSLCSRISLPVTPLIENADIDTPCYGMRVIVTGAKLNNSIIDRDVADDLIFGVTDYENTVQMPELEPGIYDINIHTIVPFARAKEHKSITIEVKE